MDNIAWPARDNFFDAIRPMVDDLRDILTLMGARARSA